VSIALIDYGAGNLASVLKGLRAVGADAQVTADASTLIECAGIVVPGVGHFGATAGIGVDMRAAILRRVEAGVPLFGICLGMQWLFEGSEESAEPGLGLLAGTCTRITAPAPLKVPHVGWNALRLVRRASILDGIDEGTHVYFTHSFAAPVTPDCAAAANHGASFAAVVQRGHVAGVQFHPEKSGEAGLRILANFVRMASA
jgi:glutamine amidotransferase